MRKKLGNAWEDFGLGMDIALMSVPKILDAQRGLATFEQVEYWDKLHRDYLRTVKEYYTNETQTI